MNEKKNVEISDLPPYIIVHIFKFIELTDLLFSVRNTCLLWNQLSRERILWRTLDVSEFHNYVFTPQKFLELLREISESVESLHFDVTQHDLKIIKHEGIVCPNLKEISIDYDKKVISGSTTSVIDVNNSLLRLSEKYAGVTKLRISNQVLLLDNIFRNLEVFVYESVDRSVETIRAIEFLENHTCLKHITLRRCILSVAILTKILTEFSQLETLDICRSTCSFEELNHALSLEDTLKVEKLKTLNVSETDVIDGFIQKIAKKANDLKSLNIAKCPRVTNTAIEFVSKYCTGLSELILNFDTVKHLEGQCDITSAGIERIAEHCHNLTVLEINNCAEVGDGGVAAIVKSCHHLVELGVAGCLSLQDATVFSLVKNCARIRQLNLGNCPQLTGRSVSSVLQNSKNLKYLNIESCHRVTDLRLSRREVCGSLVEDITSNKELKENEICVLPEEQHNKVKESETFENDNELKLEAVDSIQMKRKEDEIETVPEVLNIESKDLESQRMQSTEDNAEEFEGSDMELRIPQNTFKPLKDLSESHEAISAHEDTLSLQYLTFLENHSHIRTLNLGFCSKITNNCIKQIAQFCPDLVELDIQACYMVTNAGVRELLQFCKFLQTLNISGGSVSQTSRLTDGCLEDIIRYGKHLRKLIVVKNYNITADGAFKVVQNCEEIQSVRVEVGKRSNISKEMLIDLSGHVKDKTICLQFRADVEILVFKDAEFKLRQKCQLDESDTSNKCQ